MPTNPYGEGSPYAGSGSFLDVLDIHQEGDDAKDLASLIGGEEAPQKGLTGVLQRALNKNPNLIKNVVGGFDMMSRSNIDEYSGQMMRNAKSYYNNLSDEDKKSAGDFETWIKADEFGRALYDNRLSWDDVTGLNWLNNEGETISWGGSKWEVEDARAWQKRYDPTIGLMGQWEEEKKWKWANPTSKYYKDGSTPYRFKREYGSQGKGKGLFKYLSEEKPVTTMFEDIKSGFKERADKRKQAKSDAKAKRMEEFTTKYGISNLSKEQIEDWLPKMKEELTDWTNKLFQFNQKGNLSTQDRMMMNNLKTMIKKEGAKYEKWQKGLEDGIYPTMDEFERAEAQKVKDAKAQDIKDKHAAFLAEQLKKAKEGAERRKKLYGIQ